jgi:hypothetical protein
MALAGMYILEFVLKAVAHRFEYFADGWNILDFSVVMMAICGYVIQLVVGSNYTIALTVVRAFRVARLL